MIDSDKPEFFALIAGVYAFYRQDISDFAGSVWWQAMKPFDLAAVADAMNRHCVNPDSGQYMPKPADVVKILQGSSLDSAMVAWSKVDKAVRQVGTYASVVFDDPLIHRVIYEMGGWLKLGNTGEKEWPFVAKEFENRYRGYRVRSETPDYPRTLIGIAEAQNALTGISSQPPVLIGNADRAKQVMLRGSERPAIGFERMTETDVLALTAPQMEAA